MWQVRQLIKGVWAWLFSVLLCHNLNANFFLFCGCNLWFNANWSLGCHFTLNVLCCICIQVPLVPEMWQRCKALWTSWPNSVFPWLWSQMVAASWHISWLLFFHILVIYLAGNVTKKALVGSHFSLLSLPVFFLSSFFVILSLSLPLFLSQLLSLPYLFLLSYHTIMRKTICLSLSGELADICTWIL